MKMRETESHIYFFGSDEIFSNWHPAKFKEGANNFVNSEQYFMWQKAVFFEDMEIANKILASKNPKEHKELGRKIKNFNDAQWREARMDAMYQANYLKFSQNKKLMNALLATDGKTLVEAAWYDRIWGVGLKETDDKILNEKNWQGLNLLGMTLIKVREDLKKQQKLNNKAGLSNP